MARLLAAVGQLWTSVAWSDLPSSFNYTINEKILLNFPTFFCLHRGINTSTKELVSIFIYDKSKNNTHDSELNNTIYSGFLQNTLKYSKTLRHPYIVRVVEAVETSSAIYIVTEPITPLCLYDHIEDPSFGIYRVIAAVHFLHDSCQVVHNLISPFSIFVTDEDSQWSLGMFDCVHPVLNTNFSSHVTHHPLYDPSLDSRQVPPGTFLSDRIRLAKLVSWCYPTSYKKKIPSFWPPVNFKDSTIQSSTTANELYNALCSPMGTKNLSPQKSLKAILNEMSLFKESGLVRVMLLFEEIHLQNDFEKLAFFKTLPDALKSILCSAQYQNVLPQLKKHISLLKNPEVLLPSIFYIGENIRNSGSHEVNAATYIQHMVPVLLILLKKPDRAVRFFMLQNLSRFGSFLSSHDVESIIEPICLGFHDSVPELRDATLRSMLIFFPKLKTTKSHDMALLHVLNLLSHDTKTSIRVNALSCLEHLMESIRLPEHNKTLTPCILTSLKSPFLQCRVAALKLLRTWMEIPAWNFDYNTIMTCLVPVVCQNCVDSDGLVKHQAMLTLEGLLREAKKFLVDYSSLTSEGVNVVERSPSHNNSTLVHVNLNSNLHIQVCHTELNQCEFSYAPASHRDTQDDSVQSDEMVKASSSFLNNASPRCTEESEQFLDAEDGMDNTSFSLDASDVTIKAKTSEDLDTTPSYPFVENCLSDFSPKHELPKLANLNKSFWKNCPTENKGDTSQMPNDRVDAIKRILASRKKA